MKYQQYTDNSKAFIFELDDVIYPEKDYLLQVYYLFAQFIEYTEQIDGPEIVSFMGEIYAKEGTEGIYERTAAQFGLGEKYRVNFDLLHRNAKLPLKLLLFAPVLSLMQEVKAAGKPLFLLADGDPAIQLNKIRQIEWNGLELYLKVYFLAETATRSVAETIELIGIQYDLREEELLLVGLNKPIVNPEYATDVNFRLKRLNSLTINELFVS
ncbi:haloacid dehalogenase [Pedobacter sp. L105]|uniref:haloacid dehalogenase n=1 Tax=Pedobacter sp. L105 TaxID=1641871 RepID=UPI00131D228E|nr:haloacid dehalogenase [Pedobacter sp. L105]